jgi:hypothetical protein
VPNSPEETASVHGFGQVRNGQIVRVRDSYPKPNRYTEVMETAQDYRGEAVGMAPAQQGLGG